MPATTTSPGLRAAPGGGRSWTLRLLVLATTAAVAVSVIYLPQALLADLATDLGVPAGRAGLVATAVQAGYAVGILALVPLADRLHPRRQVSVQSLLLVVALVASAVLPDVVSLALGFMVVGLVANIAQVIIPAAGRLAPPGRAGATTATLVGAMSVGIFGGRIVASVLVELVGWRWVVVVFAGLVLAMVPLVRHALDAELEQPAADVSYLRLLSATAGLVRRSPELWQSGLVQLLVFATFNSLWTVMVLHLTAEPYGWSVRTAGLFGLVGIAAGLTAPLAGRLIDRFRPLPVAGAAVAVQLVAVATVVVDSGSVVPFAVSMLFATIAGQTTQGALQNRILAANPDRAARANTMYMFFVFLGGSAGAFLGPAAYGAGGMRGVALLGCGLSALALAVWAGVVVLDRRAAGLSPAGRPAPSPAP